MPETIAGQTEKSKIMIQQLSNKTKEEYENSRKKSRKLFRRNKEY